MPDRTQIAEWIALDWGTTRLRAWAMRGHTVIDKRETGDGMATIPRDGFEPALLRLVADWMGPGRTDVIACGMVGARQGWAETPYVAVPAKPPVASPHQAPAQSPHLRVRIIPGMKQENPADVMRGEETQIAGFLALNRGWDGILCLPGTHTKWVHVSAGEIVSFQTFMTGELFALLGRQSVLRHSIGETGWDDTAFSDAVDDTRSRPERLANALFALRAADLLHGQTPEAARSRLSGLLIGAELAASRPYWLGQQVAVIGETAPARPYVRALELQGVPAIFADGARMTLAGLSAARDHLKAAT
ncbi:2-dehydro-3-deoxygalactonokinase [Sedimentitalea sp. JM2-8]|uniref:2-dehydro-3-deoxygalactonokinase n=1 Tax=Sedimentitalea xiamensis TaxID=3050037 RepID=A0ABT7FB08_9RHOB|nr:2-dehydro-3-deoxygalactonokinase [Sedimentitalea xiamensis]MDK3072289.1 2-dehydro-3-deoxygalactonokinase [Sedimentitalea xiamensis]